MKRWYYFRETFSPYITSPYTMVYLNRLFLVGALFEEIKDLSTRKKVLLSRCHAVGTLISVY
jgi:hypothetical protein